MAKKMSDIFSSKEERTILKVIQEGGPGWHKHKKNTGKTCLDECPHYDHCEGNGPDDICSSTWSKAEVNSRTLSVLLHTYKNFDYYNQNDVDQTQESEVIEDMVMKIEDELDSFLEEDEVELKNKKGELEKMRTHKTYDRNPSLARRAKEIHLYVCMACGFDFEKAYGDLGKKYIEAHHLIPVYKKKGNEEGLNPKEDFAVLCANCHRMIHRSKYIGDIDMFSKKHVKKKYLCYGA